ncbi:pyridoxamine 5'-phosphate oxidase family protein [Haladaptatus sp. YSMS36]|uniref:pyridoxamine 5'-phosphate oxidase family protein n=1 Tax=Haladaptatus sp. YSMS36 TaxID=3033384 RepID=UPI0023E7AD12|nr:pyridoxamine 5'-phosphate oxidase family protein [Haladaptatus sp. YSMS36]
MNENSPENVADSIRYQGKAVEDESWIREFLTGQETGVLGLVDDDTPHLVTQLFVYDDEAHAIFLHGARAGRAHDLVAEGDRPRASFTTSEHGRYIPADEPVNFTVEYSSVVAYGCISLLSAADEKQAVLEKVMAKYAPQLTPGEDYQPMSDESIGGAGREPRPLRSGVKPVEGLHMLTSVDVLFNRFSAHLTSRSYVE